MPRLVGGRLAVLNALCALSEVELVSLQSPSSLSLTSGMPLAGETPTGTTDASGTKAVHELHPSLF